MSPHPVNYGKALAIVGILLNIGSAIGYLIVKDYRRSIYYGAAAVLTATMVF